MANKSIEHIVIVGGGAAGWLAAGIIAAEHSCKANDANFRLTLIESPDIGIIGVGEGTWPSMRSTLHKIGISETDFIRECDVSLKQGTLFRGWRTGRDDAYTHPFTLPHSYSDTNLAAVWQDERNKVPFAEAVSSQNALIFNNLAPKQISTPEFAFQANYGYHLNAIKFAQLLKKHCIENLGVTHLSANVVSINPACNDDIASLTTDNAGDIAGDLFIDCSGSKALLLDGHYGIPLCKKNQFLFNDTALASQVPYTNSDDAIASSTLSTAKSSGWIWDIGLSTRRGIGHVYSSAHTDEEHASKDLFEYIKLTVSPEAAAASTFKKVTFTPGHRAKCWYKNCVAIGMASGFIEPLEAAALVMVELNATMIAEQLPANRNVMDIVAKRYNDKFLYRWNRIIDFLKLHYILSERRDSDYWNDNVAEQSIPESLAEQIALWRWQTPWHRDTLHLDEMFPSASFQYILYGMGFKTHPSLTSRRSERDVRDKAARLFKENTEQTKKLIASMPTNRELIDKVKKFGFQKI